MKAKDLLRYRGLWMGFAMLWVVSYHLNANLPPNPLSQIAKIGYGGVDLFLFASGIGCFYSLSKNDDWTFYKNRFVRVMPTYLCFIVIWIVFRRLTAPLSWQEAWGNFLGLQVLTGRENYFNWYISLLILFYIASPVFFNLARNIDGFFRQAALILLLLSLSLPFWHQPMLLLITSRIPIFYLGFLFGKFCKNDGQLTKVHFLLIAVTAFAGLAALIISFRYFAPALREKGLFWYPFLLLAPGMCLFISLFGQLSDRFAPGRAFCRAIEVVGDYSFEIYLMHLFCIEIVSYLIFNACLLPDRWTSWLYAVAATAVGSVLLRFITKLALRLTKALFAFSAG